MSLHVHVVLGLPILLHVPYRQFLFYYDFFELLVSLYPSPRLPSFTSPQLG